MSGYPLRVGSAESSTLRRIPDGEAASSVRSSQAECILSGLSQSFFAKVLGISNVPRPPAKITTAHPAKILMYGNMHSRYGCNNAFRVANREDTLATLEHRPATFR